MFQSLVSDRCALLQVGICWYIAFVQQIDPNVPSHGPLGTVFRMYLTLCI